MAFQFFTRGTEIWGAYHDGDGLYASLVNEHEAAKVCGLLNRSPAFAIKAPRRIEERGA